MVASELIALLQKYPPDAVIYAYAGGNDGYYQLQKWGDAVIVCPANVVGYREGETEDTHGIVICHRDALSLTFNNYPWTDKDGVRYYGDLEPGMTENQQRRVENGYSVPTRSFDDKGDRIYIHYPLLSPVGMHGEMRCSWRMFEATWAGEN